MSEEYIYCTKCGKKLKKGSNFCTHCGASISYSEPQKSQSIDDTQIKSVASKDSSVKTINNSQKKKKVKKGSRIIQILAVLMALFILFIIFHPNNHTETFELTPSLEYQTFTTENGVNVNISPYLISSKEELTITEKSNESGSENAIKAVDVSLGDYHELNSFIEISIPFDRFNIKEGMAEDILEVYSINPNTGNWEAELSDINGDNIIVYTDHLSSFEIRKMPLGDKIRKTDIGELSSENCLKVINDINQGADVETSMMSLGFNSINESVSWAGNFSNFSTLISETKFLKDKVYGNLGLLGNTLFYITVAKDINTAASTGNFSPLANNIRSNGIGFLMGFATNPYIKAAYSAYWVVNTLGEKISSEISAEVNAKYIYAYEEVYQDRVIGPYKEKYPNNWKSAWYRDWYNKFKEAAEYSETSEEFDAAIEMLIEKVTYVPVSQEWDFDFQAYAGDYYNQKQTEDRGFLGNIVKGLESTYGNEEKEALVKSKTLQLKADLKPVLRNVSKQLLTKAEQGYFKAFKKIQNDLNTPYKLTFKLSNKLPKGVSGIYELTSNDKTVYEHPVSTSDSHTIEISLNKYFELEKPDNIRLVIIGDGAHKIEKDFNFKLEDQTILFNIPTNETVSTENNSNNNNSVNINKNNLENNITENNIIGNNNKKELNKIKESDEYMEAYKNLEIILAQIESELDNYDENTIDVFNSEIDNIIQMKKDKIEDYKNSDSENNEYRIAREQLYIDIANEYRSQGIDNVALAKIQSKYDLVKSPDGKVQAVLFYDEFAPLQRIHGSKRYKTILQIVYDLIKSNLEYGISDTEYTQFMADYNYRKDNPISYETLQNVYSMHHDSEATAYFYLNNIYNLINDASSDKTLYDYTGIWEGSYIFLKDNINWSLYNSYLDGEIIEGEGYSDYDENTSWGEFSNKGDSIKADNFGQLTGDEYDIEELLYMEVVAENNTYKILDQDNNSTYSFSGKSFYYETVDNQNSTRMTIKGTMSDNSNNISGTATLYINGSIVATGTFNMTKQ